MQLSVQGGEWRLEAQQRLASLPHRDAPTQLSGQGSCPRAPLPHLEIAFSFPNWIWGDMAKKGKVFLLFKFFLSYKSCRIPVVGLNGNKEASGFVCLWLGEKMKD